MSDAKKLSSMDASFLYRKRRKCRCMSAAWRSSGCRRTTGRLLRGLQGDDRLAAACRADPEGAAGKGAARHRSSFLGRGRPVRHPPPYLPRQPSAPHDRATLERIVGWMHAKLLNRARPLWEFYVFEGMKDNEIGLYSKMHHACIDGGAGAALTSMIYDVTPIPRTIEPPAARAKVGQEPRDMPPIFWIPISSSAPAVRCLDGRQGHRAARIGQERSRATMLLNNAIFQIKSAVKFAGAIPTMLKSVSDVVGKISDPKSRDSIASMVSPSTILEQVDFVGAQFCRRIDLAKHGRRRAGQAGRRPAQRRGAGGLQWRGPALSQRSRARCQRKSMTAAVPVSLREEGNTDANNQVFGMICSIASDIETPRPRFETIIAQSPNPRRCRIRCAP